MALMTDLQVRKLKPRRERFEVSDGDGLYLRVMPSGEKSWDFRYQFDGRPRRMTLGVYHVSPSPAGTKYHRPIPLDKLPFLTVAEARERCLEARKKVREGIDPGVERQQARKARKAAPTFRQIIGELWEVELQAKKSGAETKRLLEKDVLPAWGNRKVADIKKRDIVLLLDRIKDRGPILANRIHGALTRLFNFAAERGVIEDSPCTRIRKTAEHGRSRVLDDDEIRLLWAALNFDSTTIDLYRTSKLALKMILLTGQRPGEVCGMEWGEIDDAGVWNIPAERMKNGQLHRVPLASMALETIEAARPYSGESRFVFQSSYKDDWPITRHALSRAINRHWPEIGFKEGFTPHDLRRTLRTRLAELGVSDVVAERVLGHKLQGVLGVYNRHSYDLEKRQALELWERRLHEILGLIEPMSNVIPFGVRHA